MLRELARIIDPDFGMDIVSCGFVKELQADGGRRAPRTVSFCLLAPRAPYDLFQNHMAVGFAWSAG